jgi:two-component system, NarL family, nitrate/nitrite response regulator NarL
LIDRLQQIMELRKLLSRISISLANAARHANNLSGRHFGVKAMNVLIVDDHPMMLEYLSGAVGKALPDAVVRTAEDLKTALERAREVEPALVLVDLGLPGCGGIDSVLQFRSAFPNVPTVVVSANDDTLSVRGALAVGAAGFIPKSSSPTVVVGALRLIAGGGRYIPPEALAATPADKKTAAQPEELLTERQRDVLARMLKGSSNAQIATELNITEGTAKQHAHAVYAAFGVSSRADLILAASGRYRRTG